MMPLAQDNSVGTCWLCDAYGPLIRGHVIPKFVTNDRVPGTRLFKEQGYVKPDIRRADRDRPEYRFAQDTSRYFMFCGSCEDILGRDESAFSEIYKAQPGVINYDERLRRFSAGVFLRINFIHRNCDEEEETSILSTVTPKLRRLLLEKARPHGLYFSLVPTDYRESVSDLENFFFVGSMEATWHLRVMYFKLPGFVFRLTDYPVKFPWKLIGKGGRIDSQFTDEAAGLLAAWMEERLVDFGKHFGEWSELKQVQA